MTSLNGRAGMAVALIAMVVGFAGCNGKEPPPDSPPKAPAPIGHRILDHLDAKVDLTEHLQNIKDPNPITRAMALDAMAGTRSPRAVKPVVGLLDDREPMVRKTAAQALGTLGHPAGIDPLRKAWTNASDPVFKIWIAFALAKLADDEPSRVFLRKALKDRMPDARMNAVAALARLGDNSALENLTTMLGDSEWSVRFNAAKAVGDVGGAGSFDLLLPMLQDKDFRVVGAAAWSLGLIGDPRALDHLTPLIQGPSSAAVVDALGLLGDARAVPHVIKALHHEDDRTRTTAVRVLAKLDAKGAVPALIRCLLSDDERFRRLAAQTLQTLTEQPIPDDHAAWNRWFQEQKKD